MCRRPNSKRGTMSRPQWPDSTNSPSEIVGTIHVGYAVEALEGFDPQRAAKDGPVGAGRSGACGHLAVDEESVTRNYVLRLARQPFGSSASTVLGQEPLQGGCNIGSNVPIRHAFRHRARG